MRFPKIFSFALALLFLASPAFAAVTANSVVTAQTPTNGKAQFLQGTDSAGTYKTVYTAGTNGSKISALWMNNNDPSATHLVTCQIINTAVKYGGVALTSVVSAGYATAVPPQNLLTQAVWTGLPTDGNGNPYLTLVSGDTLQCTFATSITASDLINVFAIGSDY